MSWDFCRRFWRFLPPFFAAFAPRDPPREVHQGSPKRDPIIPHCPPSLSQKGAQNWYPSDGDRDVLAMEVGLQFTKGRKRNFKRCAAHTHRPNIIANIRRKIFCLYEVDDFIFDPVVCMIAIGILDNAFELGFTRAEDIFKLRVDRRRQTMCLRWKSQLEEQASISASSSYFRWRPNVKDEPLRYHTFLYYLQRLGMVAGMMQILNPYNIRRGTGETVDSESP